MAMLRVSSYRRLFDWSPNGGSWARCAGQYQASVRAATTDECDCDKLDFAAAKALSKEGLDQFSQERTTIAVLNDRLVRLIEMARCFEEENSSLERQVAELRERLNGRRGSVSSTSIAAQSDSSLDAVVIRLHRERDEIVQDTEKLQVELECLMKESEEAAQQRTLLWQEQRGIAEEVDTFTAACLSLREQVAIYEEQLAAAEARQETGVKGRPVPAEWTRSAVAAIKFECPDMTPALDVKEYYSQLAESLQCKCGAAASDPASGGGGVGVRLGMEEAAGRAKDVGEMKMLVSQLQKELSELETCNWELEDDVEMRKAAHTEEISGLEETIDEMNRQEVDLREQMREQCDDYKKLLAEKMARDMEIAAYRGLVEGEEGRLCSL